MPPKNKDSKADSKGKKDEKGELSPEEKLEQEKRVLETERENLAVELAFMKDKLHQTKNDVEHLQEENSQLRHRLSKASADAADILEHKQEEIQNKQHSVNSLEARVAELERLLEQRDTAISELKSLNEQNAKRLEEAAYLEKQKVKLEGLVKTQETQLHKSEELLSERQATIDSLKQRISKLEEDNKDLTLASQGGMELKILFDDPWMVQSTKCSLKEDIPVDRDFNTLTCIGKQLILYGGSWKDHDKKELRICNLDSFTWETPSIPTSQPKNMPPLTNHAAVVVGRTKILCFGGRRGSELVDDLKVLNTDNLKWSVPATKSLSPSPREGAALWTLREKVFCFGGETEEGLANDLWQLDTESWTWGQVQCYGPPPSARRDATLVSAEDGRRLWVFGGHDGARCLNDVYVLEMERLTWSYININSAPPEARMRHSATAIGHYMVISGGMTVNSKGERKGVYDTQALDMSAPSWDVLDEGLSYSTLYTCKPNACYTAFYTNKLYMLKPNREENKLDEIEVLEFALPDDIEGLKAAKRREAVQERLELLDTAVCSSNSIELTWRPPTKNADRIDRFKLMMATTTGVVKEVMQGKFTTFRLTGLRPNQEYIFCVKAIFDDGSFLWSESKSFWTKS
mmetsp:Transcript_33290/g.78947  ORF Transcript_33290/g.78947 Transcript_33290/m.78947 type:complete len:632 (+) Transcript_33290:204-2099(+)